MRVHEAIRQHGGPETACGHWNGFSAFHPERPGEAPIAIECKAPLSLWGDCEAGLKAVYEPDA